MPCEANVTRSAALIPPWQAANGWGVPFPFYLLTWPFDICEVVLRWQISHQAGQPLA